jgi:hypothetical protein
MMVKRDRDLNESLQEPLLRSSRQPPDVFPGFMRFEELAAIEIIHGAQMQV